MATRSERDAYVRRLTELLREMDYVERTAVEDSIRLLRDLRDGVVGQLSTVEPDQFHISELDAAIAAIIAAYLLRARSLVSDSVQQAFVLGERAAVEPLQQANITIPAFRPSTAQIDVISNFSADLITKIGNDTRNRINRIIRLNALGGKSSLDSMKEITAELFKTQRPPSPTTRQPVKGVAYEAERILRTEVNRAFNLASFGQQEALARNIPGLQKMWAATGDSRTRRTHLLAHGQIKLVNEPFEVGVAELMMPLDPAGPPEEVINCRCRSITILPDIGRVRMPLDARVERERNRRGIEAVLI